MIKIKKLSLILGSVLFGLVLSEIGTRLVESKLERVQVSGAWFGQVQIVPDAKLGLRVAPNSVGHDANGFRNRSVPTHADIVAVGDSLTWGQNATIDDAWPQRLGQLSGMTVYNMGTNGYGPIEYLVLTEDAIKFSPKVLVVGLYFGNDLWDAYHAVYSRDEFAAFRNPDLAEALRNDTVANNAEITVTKANQLSEEIRRSSNSTWLEWLGHHTAIGRQLSYRGRWPGETTAARNVALRKAINRFPAYGVAYDSEQTHTILTTSYRLAALDRNEIRIIEGLRITKLALSQIQELTRRGATKLIVLLIPTKELVFADKVAALGKIDSTYAALVQMETADRDEIKDYCSSRRIQVVDVLPALSAAVGRNQQIYLESADGHPNSAGYDLIAKAVKGRL